jgi:twitching motility protein PilT
MPRIDAFLEIGRQQGASDIHFAVGLPPLVRLDDDLMPVQYRALTDQECHDLVREIMDDHHLRHARAGRRGGHRLRVRESRPVPDQRRAPPRGPLRHLPDHPRRDPLARRPRPAARAKRRSRSSRTDSCSSRLDGHGKSTTMAAMIREINERESLNIITLEDPIEFVHKSQRCQMIQREVGTHVPSFMTACGGIA